ncbi:tyrosine-type recombinase/integrase [Xanthobacter aminoxidans]|uniref:Tyrosine-type recombinase/integrase n=1 Tax=Xanthobacter aminoxidans TaxID=186280 RepID=A0ABW6ZCA1_9HYPH
MRFTKPTVAGLQLPAGKSEALFWDDDLPGFGIRLRVGGSRTWVFQYKLGTKQRRITIGRADVIELNQAKKAATEIHAKVKLGGDPQGAKATARVSASRTLGSVIESYLEAYEPTVRASTFRNARLHLRTHLKPLHGMALDKIGHGDISARLTVLRREIGTSTGDHTRVALSGLYGWAISEGLVNDNPVMRTRSSRLVKAKAGESPTGGRARTLSAEELGEVWRACLDDDFGRIVRLLILTLQRREEIAALSWDEVDLTKGIISLPPARTKNGREHLVPISTAAAQILAGVEHRDERDFLFGEGKGSFSGFSKAKRMLEDRVHKARLKADPTAKPMPHWTLHDLRRTGATMMNESPPLGLGMQPHIVEAILNHVSGTRAGVAGIYNRALYLAEKTAALEAWGEHVIKICRGR